MGDHTVRVSCEIQCLCSDRGRLSASWGETAVRWLRLAKPGAFTPLPGLLRADSSSAGWVQLEGTPKAHSHIFQPLFPWQHACLAPGMCSLRVGRHLEDTQEQLLKTHELFRCFALKFDGKEREKWCLLGKNCAGISEEPIIITLINMKGNQ